jgi:shikimate dehydrogenase
MDSSPHVYRALVEEIRDDDEIAGAVVTTHKVNVFRHAGELFDSFDDWTHLCGEVSSISKLKGALTGGAIDPVSSRRALGEMLPPGHWDRGAGALILGAGGAGIAMTVALLAQTRPPDRIDVVDRDATRIGGVEGLRAHWPHADRVAPLHVRDAHDSDEILSRLPVGSLVVNATGAGKDSPGSPLPEAPRWPSEAVVWELNYRGTLEFLAQARRARFDRRLRVFDGWRLFVHGWTEGLVRIFGVEYSPRLLRRMADAADPFRPQ